MTHSNIFTAEASEQNPQTWVQTKHAIRAKHAMRAKRASGISRIGLAASVLVGALALSGCANHSKSHFTVGSTPDHYKTRHPIIIDEKEQTLDVPVATGSFDLPLSSASAIEGFTDRFLTSASGHILVMMPRGSANERAARMLGAKVATTVKKRGVPGHRVRMVTYAAHKHGASAPIRLSYSAIKAAVTGCGKWKKDLTASSENKNYHNFGCATQNNLAAMVANPADLLGPRGMSNVDAARRENVIRDYRSGDSTSTTDDFATISTIY
ncbi:MAG: CpaD family pilus assembly lipoprotein [Pseudomonadota bacterium]